MKTRDVIISFCMCIFFITFPLFIIREQMLEQDIFSQVLIIMVYGLSGIGLYAIFGSKFQEIMEKAKMKKEKTEDEKNA